MLSNFRESLAIEENSYHDNVPIFCTCTIIRFVSISAKFGIGTVVGLNGALVDAKIRTLKCPKV
jgi:hypothetical protein